MPNEQIIFNIACALIASLASVIAWFAKKNYADLDKKVDANTGDIRLLVERVHQLAILNARSESVTVGLTELKSEVKELTKAVEDLRIGMARSSQTNEHNHGPRR